MPAGRPSMYSTQLTDEICARISKGMSVREICRADDMPSLDTIFKWLAKHAEFAEHYARATSARADYWAEEMLEISDDGTNDWTDRQIAPGVIRRAPDQEVVNRSKLRVDTRKWLMAKMQPRKYGERQITEHTGGEKPVTIVVDTGIKRKKDEE